MHAIPPEVDRAGDHVAGVSCPECSGVVAVRTEGRPRNLLFECRVGHTFTPPELLIGKEERLDLWLWCAYTTFQELIALTADLAERETSEDVRRRYEERRTNAQAAVDRLHRVIEGNRPIAVAGDGAATAPPS